MWDQEEHFRTIVIIQVRDDDVGHEISEDTSERQGLTNVGNEAITDYL